MEVSELSMLMSLNFESLYAGGDPNWSVPNTWLMEDANDPDYQIMNDEEIVEDVLQERRIRV